MAGSVKSGRLAYGVEASYDGSTPLPKDLHEKFSQLVAAGATHTSAILSAHPNGGSLLTPVQSAGALAKKEHIKRRIRYLRESKARVIASEDNLFEGFVHAVETAMDSISELVTLCTIEGLSREAGSARAALGSLAGRTFTHRHSLSNADERGHHTKSRVKELLKAVFKVAPHD